MCRDFSGMEDARASIRAEHQGTSFRESFYDAFYGFS